VKHSELCQRAVRWLRGSQRCNPVFSGIASASEVPDAIGWSSNWKLHGSHVVECKVSRTDFLRDKAKLFPTEFPKKECPDCGGIGYVTGVRKVCVCRAPKKMGDFRWFLTPSNLIAPYDLAKHYPDHGLLWLNGRGVRIIVQAPRRTELNRDTELRLMRFAIINRKLNQATMEYACQQ
jgi:hypothetical protein